MLLIKSRLPGKSMPSLRALIEQAEMLENILKHLLHINQTTIVAFSWNRKQKLQNKMIVMLLYPRMETNHYRYWTKFPEPYEHFSRHLIWAVRVSSSVTDAFFMWDSSSWHDYAHTHTADSLSAWLWSYPHLDFGVLLCDWKKKLTTSHSRFHKA